MIARRLLAVAGVVLATTLLTACPSPPPEPDPSTSTSAPDPTPTPTATDPVLADDVAFVVTGTLVSPDGATEVSFELTVGAPGAGTPADLDAFANSAHCPPDLLDGYAPYLTTAEYLHLSYETTVVSGALAAQDYAVPLYTNFPTTWDGDWQSFQAYCATPVLTPVPGAANGIGVVEADTETGDGITTYGWVPTAGGFGLALERPNGDGTVVLYVPTACAIEFGPASAGTAAAGFIQVDEDFGCSFGLADS